MQAEYDDNYVSEITIEDGKEFYRIDGEEFPASFDGETTTTVTENDFELPLSAIEPFIDLPEISTYSLDTENKEDITVDKETAESLGFDVEIEDDKAVLTQPYQTERLIVKSKYDINPLDSVAMVEGYNDLHIVQFDNQESTKQAEEYYNKQKLIEYAEPDLVMSIMEFEDSEAESVQTYGINDYGYHLSWGSEDIGVDDYVDYLGDISVLPEIVVGVIDTGIDVDHDFLKDRIIRTNYNISTSGDENDENDDKGHGTHVAGIIADNTTENVKIKGYKVLSSTGQGTLSDVIIAFDYAVADGVNIINMSLSAKGESKTFEKSINKATEMGVIVCVSAGNHGRDARKDCPANIEACLTVGAFGKIDGEDLKINWPYWTNHGPLVDIIAPGMSIYSTYLDNGYETLSGTSMACPFVAASSALLLSRDIDLNTDGICDLLQENCKATYKDPPHHRLYIAEITEYNKLRTEKPVFSVESGRYSDSVTVELSCPEENAEIYYTLDGSRASKANGIKYTESIVIDKVTKVHAAAYAGDKLKSLQAISDYYITVTDAEGNFEIDTNGLITAYNGTSQYLTIPDTINGITVTGIGKSVFSSSEHDIIMIKFPDTLTFVDQNAFSQSKTLKSVYCKNLKTVGKRAFYGCRNLDTIDLSQLETVDEYGFGHCNLQEVSNDKLTRIERCAFTGLANAISVNLPNVVFVDNMGLCGLNSAEYINIPKVETLSANALLSDVAVETLNLPNLTTITGSSCFSQLLNLKELNVPKLCGNLPSKTFSGVKLECIDLPHITSVSDEAFRICFSKIVKLPNVTTVGEKVFDSCYYLEELYIPSVTEIGSKSFNEARRLKTIFAPSLKTIVNLPTRNGITLYLSDCFNSADNPEYDYTIIAPTGSYAQQYANENGHIFIPSDSRDNSIQNPSNVTDLGRSICTSVAGLRFGFTWNNIDEIENLASDIEYGFIYSQKGSEDLTIDTVDGKTVKKAVANNRVDHGDTTSFNLVISNIPKAYYDRVITARAYVCIDGMYFYSNMLKGSFDEVANLVLEDDEIDLNTKNAVNNLLNKEI